MGGSEKEKKEKKDKGDKKDKKKERAESRKDLKSAAAKTEEANKAAEASAPAPAAAAAIPVAAKDPQPVAEIAAAASAPTTAPAAPSAAVEHKEPVATPASPGRDTDKKPVTRERAKTLDDGIPSNAKKEKEREGKPKYELVDLNKQVRPHRCSGTVPLLAYNSTSISSTSLLCRLVFDNYPINLFILYSRFTRRKSDWHHIGSLHPSLTRTRASACVKRVRLREPGRVAVRC